MTGPWQITRVFCDFVLSNLLSELPREAADRLSLAQASHNAGLRNILQTQYLIESGILYRPIIGELHRIRLRRRQVVGR